MNLGILFLTIEKKNTNTNEKSRKFTRNSQLSDELLLIGTTTNTNGCYIELALSKIFSNLIKFIFCLRIPFFFIIEKYSNNCYDVCRKKKN